MKTTNIIPLICMLFIGIACKKSVQPIPFSATSLSMGYTYNDPKVVVNFYLVTESSLYEASNVADISNPHFSTVALPASKYTSASPLLKDIPSYFFTDTISGTTIFGPVGGSVLHLTFTQNQQTVSWNLPSDTAVLPQPIRAYVQQVRTILPNL